MVPRALASLPRANFLQGSHELFVDGQLREPRAHGNGYLAHFPLRSPGQHAAKVAVHLLQYHVMARRNWRWAYHYQDPFALLKRDGRAFAASFLQAARRYGLPAGTTIEPGTVLDPIAYRGGPLRYTPRVDDGTRAWHALLHYADDLARQYAVLAASLTEDQQLSVQQQATVVAELYAQLEEQRKERAARAASLTVQLEQWQKERIAMAADANAQREMLAQERAYFLGRLEELRRSRTWRIGRLFVGPVAWARQSRKRCSQALVRVLRPGCQQQEELAK
jgi:hypothetical protein